MHRAAGDRSTPQARIIANKVNHTPIHTMARLITVTRLQKQTLQFSADNSLAYALAGSRLAKWVGPIQESLCSLGFCPRRCRCYIPHILDRLFFCSVPQSKSFLSIYFHYSRTTKWDGGLLHRIAGGELGKVKSPGGQGRDKTKAHRQRGALPVATLRD